MARNAIIVDESRTRRKLTRATIAANLSDVICTEADGGRQALELLSQGSFHLVFSAWEMADIDGPTLFTRMQGDDRLKKVPFILCSSKEYQEQAQFLSMVGITHYLKTPIQAESLIHIVDRACNPATIRRAERHSFDDTCVAIRQGPRSFPADLVNISLGGLLCEGAAHDEYRPTAISSLEVDFPGEFNNVSVGGLLAVLVRLEVVSHYPDYTPEKNRMAYRFIQVQPEAKAQLETAFNKRKQLLLQTLGTLPSEPPPSSMSY